VESGFGFRFRGGLALLPLVAPPFAFLSLKSLRIIGFFRLGRCPELSFRCTFSGATFNGFV
jgi:hypothetical protein